MLLQNRRKPGWYAPKQLYVAPLRPDRGLLGPDAIGEYLLKVPGNVSQHGVVFAGLVVAHAAPIDGFSGAGSLGMMGDNIFVELFGVGPALAGECNAGGAELELRPELLAGIVTLGAEALHAAGIEDHYGRRPQHGETVECRGLIFNVDSCRRKCLVDVSGDFGVSVGFGFQPNTSASRGCGAEIQ